MSHSNYSVADEMLENVYVHLVNNSIGKNSENFGDSVDVDSDTTLQVAFLSFSWWILTCTGLHVRL